MAHYKATLETRLPPEEVFAYLSDFANTEEWDPGTVRAERLDDGPVGAGSEFRLVAAFLGRESAITYHTTQYDPPYNVSFRGENAMVVSRDRITVVGAATGAEVTYDAELTLKGPPLTFADPLLGLAFKRLGDKALAGMRATLVRKEAEMGEPRSVESATENVCVRM